MKVISIGDLVLDYVYKDSKLLGVNGGMSSHNIIANLASMGINTSVIGVCGDDSAGEISIKSLNDLKVDTTNIHKLDNINTRCFHINMTANGFTSKKRCPICNKKHWYDESKIVINDVLKNISKEDILVLDNLNNINSEIIKMIENKVMLDLGQYYDLEKYSKNDIKDIFKRQFEIVNLNERVEKYILKLFDIENISKIINSKLIVITRGNKGADFIINNKKIHKKLNEVSKEVDPNGAGDAFFSVFIYEYLQNNQILNEDYIDNAFNNATKLTQNVVKQIGARGHLHKLYKVKQDDNLCTCENFILHERKLPKRYTINVNNLETRILNAVNSDAKNKLSKISFEKLNNCIFIGTGGSFAAANFASKVVNDLYGVNTFADLPRNIKYKNNSKVDKCFMFSYSGTTNDLLVGTENIDNSKKIVITKGEISKVCKKTNIDKDNIISYRTPSNKGKERGFISFEGVMAPASLFLNLYFEKLKRNDINEFIIDSISYWKYYFDSLFKEDKRNLKSIFRRGNIINIFHGDFTSSAAIDLESTFIESGVFNVLLHEKKNFSHGRFINYEHLSGKMNIYLKTKNVSLYEEKLLKYLSQDKNIIIESRYDGLLAEYDLLIAVQYFIYHISKLLNIDISKPNYSEDAMKIYFYKGDL